MGSRVLAEYRPEEDALCWSEIVDDRALWWIHGPAEGEWYAVGELGAVVHSVDGELSREDVPTEATLYGVWAGDGEVWAVGGTVATDEGEIWRKADGAWSLFAGGLPGVVFKVWKRWMVGNEAGWYRAGETAETLEARHPQERLLTVRGESEEDAWAVGGSFSSVVLRWREDAWEEQETAGLGQPLNGVWTAPGETVWVAGMSGSQAYLEDGAWKIPDFPLTGEHYHAVWKHGDEALFLGGNLLSTAPPYHGIIGRHGPARGGLEVSECQ